MTHLKKENARRICISMLKIILEQNDNFLRNGALVYQYCQCFDLLWFYFLVWTWTRLPASGHWKNCHQTSYTGGPLFIYFWNWRTIHTSCTESVNAPNQSHLNFILSVHLRGEKDIEAGSNGDESVVVYCNTITKS